jgi:diguanylate cyclase (GGDEF)-like protein/PAS domain S-box-containing protein
MNREKSGDTKHSPTTSTPLTESFDSFHHNPNPIFLIGADNQLVEANPASETVFPEFELSQDTTIPDDLATVVNSVRKEDGRSEQEIKISGRDYLIQISPCPSSDRLFLFLSDVTDRPRDVRHAEERDRWFRTLAENVNEVFWMFNGDFSQFLYANEAVEEVYGVKRDELSEESMKFMDEIYPAHRKKVLDGIEELKKGHKTDLEYRVNSDEDYRRWVAVRGVPIVESGEVVAMVGSAREITERKEYEKGLLEAHDRLRSKSYRDALTQIPNRRFFDERLEEEWGRARRDVQHLGLIMADIDWFKQYNDTYGHQMGDESLRQIASVFEDSLDRESDTVARYGGEEFGIILPGTDREGVKAIGNRLRSAVRECRIEHRDSRVKPWVTVSFGGSSVVPSAEVSARNLLATADRALYHSKSSGRDQVTVLDCESNSGTVNLE